MAWYNVGTVTATNNSATITGVGTAFISNIRVGDGVTITGSTSIHEVTNIISETQLTVSPVYPGTTGSGKTYGVIPVQGYVQGLADQAKQLILSYSTITGTSGAYDTTPGRLLRVGDFGIGAIDLIDTGVDLNTLNATGFYLVASPAINMPSGHSAGFLTVKTNALSNIVQTFESQGTTTCFERFGGGGGWGAWRLRYNQSTILGTVSQSAGVPTGAIMESGSSANGWFYKFATGMMICLMPSTAAVFANTSNISVGWTFPAAFVGSVSVQANTTLVSGVPGITKYFSGPYAYSVTTTTSALAIFSPANFVAADATSVAFTAIAVGRWTA